MVKTLLEFYIERLRMKLFKKILVKCMSEFLLIKTLFKCLVIKYMNFNFKKLHFSSCVGKTCFVGAPKVYIVEMS